MEYCVILKVILIIDHHWNALPISTAWQGYHELRKSLDRERKNMKEALAPPESKGSDEDNDNIQGHKVTFSKIAQEVFSEHQSL